MGLPYPQWQLEATPALLPRAIIQKHQPFGHSGTTSTSLQLILEHSPDRALAKYGHLAQSGDSLI